MELVSLFIKRFLSLCLYGNHFWRMYFILKICSYLGTQKKEMEHITYPKTKLVTREHKIYGIIVTIDYFSFTNLICAKINFKIGTSFSCNTTFKLHKNDKRFCKNVLTLF